jgi:hypothetical protein
MNDSGSFTMQKMILAEYNQLIQQQQPNLLVPNKLG